MAESTSTARREFTLRALRWVAVTILAAIIGAFGTWFVNRARPIADIAAINISRAFHDRFRGDRSIAIDSTNPAVSSLQKSNWAVAIREPSMPLNELVDALEDNQERVDRYLQSIQRFGADIKEMEKILSRNSNNTADAVEFFDLWERNDRFIYGSIRGYFHRGVYTLPEQLPIYQGPEFLLRDIAGRASVGDDSVPFLGASKRGGFYISALIPTREEDFRLNAVVTEALIHFDRQTLKSMLDLAKEELGADLLHKEIRKATDKYLVGLSRWSISVVVANAGGFPLSIAPKAQLFVNSEDTSLDTSSNPSPIVIPLEIRDQDGHLTPVSVPGGESTSARFVSHKLISEFSGWESLHEMYQDRSLNCILLIEVTPTPMFGRKQVLSSTRRFGEIEPSSKVNIDRIKRKF